MHAECVGVFFILSEPDCPGADALGRALVACGQAVCRVRADLGNGFDALRVACQGQHAVRGLAAFGPMCACGLALAIQRSVERLALICGGRPIADCGDARLARFVRRNLALCAADVLCVYPTPADLRHLRHRLPERSGLCCVTTGEKGRTECEFSVENAICDFFLSCGSGKSLAENAEMCIIYR